MTDYSTHSLDELIDVITTWPVGMPVRAMERVLAMGERAVPSLIEAFDLWRADEDRDLLWLVVLLGETRSEHAVQALIHRIQATDEEEWAEAASEGLAKIGAPSLPALRGLLTAPDPLVRTYVYGALSGIRDDQAFSLLVGALGRDHALGDVLAQALCDQGRRESVPLLYDAYRSCEPWQRIEFEEAIRDIHFGRTEPPISAANWRVRYRRNPALGGFALSWLSIAVVAQKHGEEIIKRVVPPVRSLEEILEHDAVSQACETCEDCGAPIEQPTGLPVCPEIALGVTLQQVVFLGDARENGSDDILELFDELDDRLWEHCEKKEQLAGRERERWRERKEDLEVQRQTCGWLVEQGIQNVSQARALLLAKTAELADRFGDPEGLLSRAGQTQRTSPKVGRNDPCPCGSGQKYKRCCLGK